MNQATLDRYKRFVIANYTRYPVCLVRGEGSVVYDDDGRRYLDFFPGWGCGLLGHCPPRVVEAVQKQAATLIHVPNTWHTEPQALLAEALAPATTWGGMELLLQLRHRGQRGRHQARPPQRRRPLQDHHLHRLLPRPHDGRAHRDGPAEVPPGRRADAARLLLRPVRDLDRAAKLVDDETIAILLEPIQGEGGVNVPPPGFLQGLRTLADERRLLLIFDECRRAWAVPASGYAHQHWGVEPDVVTLAKALGRRRRDGRPSSPGPRWPRSSSPAPTPPRSAATPSPPRPPWPRSRPSRRRTSWIVP